MPETDTVTWGLVRFEEAVLIYFCLVNSFYALLLVCAYWEMRQHLFRTRGESRWRLLGSRAAPNISMTAPACNEAATIGDSVRGLLTLHYPNLEVVVVNDGAKDDTMAVLAEEFDLVPTYLIYNRRIETKQVRSLFRSRSYPNLVVVDKENGGKADALNAGLNVAIGELVCAIDADTLIEPDAIQRMVLPFLVKDDVVAAGGTIRVINSCRVVQGRVVAARAPRRPVPGFQVREYMRAFLFARLGWNRLGGNLIISGAFGLFGREAIIAAGGYDHDTVGEDMELVLRLRRQGYEQNQPCRVEFIPDPVAWTLAPSSLRVLAGQRYRWHRGLADVMWKHRRILLNPRYGALGMVVYPYFFFVELLAPVVEALGLVATIIGLSLGAINLHFALLLLLVAYGYGLVLTTFTLVLEEMSYLRYEKAGDRLVIFLWVLLENFGYRQLSVVWRLCGLVRFLRGDKGWGVMERERFNHPKIQPEVNSS